MPEILSEIGDMEYKHLNHVCTKISVIYINDIYHDKYHDIFVENIMIFMIFSACETYFGF